MGKWTICSHGFYATTCEICKKEYERNYHRKHYIPHTHQQVCVYCGTIFETKQNITCSPECYRLRRNSLVRKRREHPPKMLICVECGRPFETYSGTQLICDSKKCKSSYRNKKDKEFRANVRSHYGTRCAVCGATTDLEIDHKYGYGREHRIAVCHNPHASTAFYRWLRDNGYPKDYTVNGITYKDGFRVLCSHHNNTRKIPWGNYATKKNGRWRPRNISTPISSLVYA